MDHKPTYDELEQKVIKLQNEISELKEAKKRLQVFASAIDDSTEGMTIIDRNGNVKYLNKTFAEVHGYSVDELLGKHFSIFHTPEQMPVVNDANRQVKEKESFVGECWHVRRDGTVFPTTMHNSLVRDEEGRPVYFLGTLRDISEQKKLERELLESRNKYRSLFEGSLNPITVFDRNGIVLMINTVGAENLGLSVDACIGKSITELLPDRGKIFLPIFQRVVDNRMRMFRKDLIKLSSGFRWFWSILEPVSNIQGEVYGVQIISHDITKQKKAESRIQESKRRLKDFIDSATDSFVFFDSELNILEVNKAHMEMFHPGINPQDIIGKNLAEIVPNLRETGRYDDFMKVMETGIPFFADNIIPYPKFGMRNLSLKAFKMEGGLGTITADITRQKQTERALYESEKWHRNFLENLSDVVYEADSSGNITYVNKMAESLTGVPLKEIIGKPFLPFFEKKSQEVAADVYLRTLNGESLEYELLFKNGKIAHFKNRPLKNNDGKIIGVFGTARDITDLRKAEKMLRSLNERLEQQVKERTIELEEKNTTLKVLLDQRNEDKKQFEKAIMSNVKELLIPHLIRLRDSGLDSRQQTELNILESNLNEIVSPMETSLTSSYMKLTSTEIQVANFIKHGATSKQIALSLNLSRRTIDTHRYNIRKKMGLGGKGVNLKTYLSSQ